MSNSKKISSFNLENLATDYFEKILRLIKGLIASGLKGLEEQALLTLISQESNIMVREQTSGR